MNLGPILPDSAFAPVLDVLRGVKWAYLRLPGNAGDEMIAEGTRQLLDRNRIFMSEYRLDIPSWADGLLVAGGGNIGRIWDFSNFRKGGFIQAEKRGLRIVILPQSICDPNEYMPSQTIVFVRERESLRHFPDGRIAPDMSFALTADIPLRAPQKRRGVFLRSDHESVFGRPSGSDSVRIAKNWREYIELASENEEVVTDRLHFAIASLMAGRKTILLPNAYHKNKSMWDSWLKDVGCGFENTP